MLSWKMALSIPDPTWSTDAPHPDVVFRARVEDGTLYAAVWGNGSQNTPHRLQIAFFPLRDPGADAPDARLPTFDEILSAADNVLPTGTVLAADPFPSLDPDDRTPAIGFSTASFHQIGVVPNTPANRISGIVHPIGAFHG